MSWLIEALVTVVVCAGLAAAGYWQGHANGVNQQKVVDQKQFDAINDGLARQKVEAQALLEKAQTAIIDLQKERADFNAKLEKQHADDSAATDNLRAQLATRGLRFKAPAAPACRPSSAGAASSPARTPTPAASTFVQLPEEIAGPLRQLVLDADALKDNYKLCRDYVMGAPS